MWKDSRLRLTRLGCIHTLFISNYAWVSRTEWSCHITDVSQDWHYCSTPTQSWLSLPRFLTENFGSCMPVIVSNRVPSWGLLSNLPCDCYPKQSAASSVCSLTLITDKFVTCVIVLCSVLPYWRSDVFAKYSTTPNLILVAAIGHLHLYP
jgi:hypothetical protein